MDRSYTEARAGVNDNPFLSEATRVGRIAKLEQLYNERTANIRGEIATKKADVETQLNLQLKQFDINSQQAQQSLSQFNTLLSAGALDSASGEDIANITRSTGISSAMIQSAIAAKKKKETNTQLVSFDDGTNQGFAIVDQNTGEIIKTQNVAASKPPASTVSDTKNTRQSFTEDARTQNFPDLLVKYASVMTLEEIYAAYLNSEMGKKYGKPTEDPREVKLLYQVARGEISADEAREELGG